MDRRDELAAKFAELNSKVASRQKMQQALDELVRLGLLAYDEETGEYTRLGTDADWERKMGERE